MAKLSYEELAELIARYVYENIARDEPRINMPPLFSVDNQCASYYQIPTGVLYKLDILTPIDNLKRRSVFSCEPSEFRQVAAKNMTNGCEYDTLILAIIFLAKYFNDDDLRSCLVDLGVFENVESNSHEFRWVAGKKEYYDQLSRNWPSLI